MAETTAFPKTARNKVRRLPKRGVYDKTTIYGILDEGFVCHVGFVVNGQPFVIPTNYVRHNDTLLIHGSSASRMMKAMKTGVEVCVTVTHVDGLVLARSAFHSSVNYRYSSSVIAIDYQNSSYRYPHRSVTVFGVAEEICAETEKAEAMELMVEGLVPGRWSHIRRPNASETKATTILRLRINEAAAKVREGPPGDDKEDYVDYIGCWGGVLPLQVVSKPAIPDDHTPTSMPVPEHVSGYWRTNEEKLQQQRAELQMPNMAEDLDADEAE